MVILKGRVKQWNNILNRLLMSWRCLFRRKRNRLVNCRWHSIRILGVEMTKCRSIFINLWSCQSIKNIEILMNTHVSWIEHSEKVNILMCRMSQKATFPLDLVLTLKGDVWFWLRGRPSRKIIWKSSMKTTIKLRCYAYFCMSLKFYWEKSEMEQQK